MYIGTYWVNTLECEWCQPFPYRQLYQVWLLFAQPSFRGMLDIKILLQTFSLIFEQRHFKQTKTLMLLWTNKFAMKYLGNLKSQAEILKFKAIEMDYYQAWG